MEVFGRIVDNQTRCIHYRTNVDVIAIKFMCCRRYYPCHLCHEEEADHQTQTWPGNQWSEPAVLCGVCKSEMSIHVYRAATSCPKCSALFNPRCSAHAHLYFQTT